MGQESQDFDPWVHLQRSPWQSYPKQLYTKLNGVSNLNLPNSGHSGANLSVFPANMSPCGETTGGIIPPQVVPSKFIQMTPAFRLSLNPLGVPTGAAPQRRFIIFDQSGNQTRLLFSSVSPPVLNRNPANIKQKPSDLGGFQVDLPVDKDPINLSDETSVYEENSGNEMHEDSEEIDALLYSDSEDGEGSSTGDSPVKTSGAEEEVASSGVPPNRKRLNEDVTDVSLMDTASSAERVNGRQHAVNRETDDSDESSYVKGMGKWKAEFLMADHGNKRLKREQIHETVAILQQIIPGGGQGKDAAVVLDKAIQYLKSLKAEVFGASL